VVIVAKVLFLCYNSTFFGEFTMKAPERARLIKIYNQLYERLYLEEGYVCFYCNDEAEGLDHTPPLAWIETYSTKTLRENKIPFALIPCCAECNRLLSDRRLLTAEERLEFLETKYQSLYTKVVAWDEDEIAEMGQAFQKSIKNYSKRKDEIARKIQAIKQRSVKPWTFPIFSNP
jgi:hypothetical protein